MKLSKLILKNIRSFKNIEIDFSDKINVIVGANNSGKSTILHSILEMQYETLKKEDIRKDSNNIEIKIFLNGNTKKYFPDRDIEFFLKKDNHFGFGNTSYERLILNRIDNKEPNNYIYPHLSKRKAIVFNEEIKKDNEISVPVNYEFLYSKIDRISNPGLLGYDFFKNACENILGIKITVFTSDKGKKAGYIINDSNNIPIDKMGEGVPNILGLITYLAIAEDKLFLIEELENDIHPRVLKQLLELIIEKSDKNQFIITTHSNIVMKYLGAQMETKIIKVSMEYQDKIPTSSINYIETQEDRKLTLDELGYELYDFDLWEAWLFLEEASAERIIRDYLIPIFTPDLKNKIKAFSAHSRDEIKIKFRNFNDLFVFLHLVPIYKNKVWVIIDGGEDEKEIIDKLKEMYIKSGWQEEHFKQFKEHDFEKYYPNEFQGKIDKILIINNNEEKRSKKIELLNEVIIWLNEDETRAKTALEESAKEVIEILRNIENELN